MERERLRLNHSFIMEDMEEDTMEDIEDTMVATEATMEREMLRLNQRLNHSIWPMLDIILVMAILDMVMLDILTPPTPMERERLRLNHSFIMEDMEEDTMEDIEDTMVATEATMEREMLRLIPNMFMDIILVTAPLDMDIVATHPIHMDTLDKHQWILD